MTSKPLPLLVSPANLTAPPVIGSIGPPASLRAAVHDLAPEYPLYDVQAMAARTATATVSARFSSGVLGLFSIIAIALAAVGIYGVMAVLVGQRTEKIGIRMAIGADARAIVAMVVGQGLQVTAIGTAIGLVFAAASRGFFARCCSTSQRLIRRRMSSRRSPLVRRLD